MKPGDLRIGLWDGCVALEVAWQADAQVDAYGRLQQRVLGNGVTRTVHWAADGTLADALVTFYDVVVDTTVVVAHDEYVYEASGRTGAVVDHVDGTAMCFTYDAFNRLAAAFTNPVVSDVTGCDTAPATMVDDVWVVGDAPYASLWEYSPAGHMTTQTLFTQDSGVVSIEQQVFTYGEMDHPHAVTQVTGDTTSSFDYDDAGRLVSRTTDTTDPATEMDLVWDGTSNLVQTVQDGELHRFIYDASGQRVVRIAGGTATANLGATELTDANVTTASGVVGTRYITAGGVNLATITAPTTTGLTYLNARYYDTTTARFISPDPLLNPGDPRMLDAYMYANNNSITYTDATGLCAWLVQGSAEFNACSGAKDNYGSNGNQKKSGSLGGKKAKDPQGVGLGRTSKAELPNSTGQGSPDWLDQPVHQFFDAEQLRILESYGTPEDQEAYIARWVVLSAVKIEYLAQYPDKEDLIEVALHTAMYNDTSSGYSPEFSLEIGQRYHYGKWREVVSTESVPKSFDRAADYTLQSAVATVELMGSASRFGIGPRTAGRIDADWVRSGIDLGHALEKVYDLGDVSVFTFDFDRLG